MKMRAEVERNTATGVDDFGHPIKPKFTALTYNGLATFPCWAWSNTDREVVDGDKNALVEDFRAIFPRRADVVAGDQIAQITDRRGVTLFGGRFHIETMSFAHDLQEAGLQVVS